MRQGRGGPDEKKTSDSKVKEVENESFKVKQKMSSYHAYKELSSMEKIPTLEEKETIRSNSSP